MVRLQITHGHRLLDDSNQAAGNGGFWLDEFDVVISDHYTKIAEELVNRTRGNQSLAQMIVVNRLMRGALWVVHNGNAPSQDKRTLECSLSSQWLEDNSTIYII